MANFSSFLDRLEEGKRDRPQREILFAIMNANPATKYHANMARFVENCATLRKMRHIIFLTECNAASPFNWEQRMYIVENVFPKNINVSKISNFHNVFDVSKYLSEQGYTDIVFVGTPAVGEILNERLDFFDTVDTIIYDKPNPDKKSAGWNGSDFLKSILQDDIGKFRAVTNLQEEQADGLFLYAKHEMGIE